MKVIYSEAHRHHDGAMELMFNQLVPQFEKPARMDMIMKRLKTQGFTDLVEPDAFDLTAAQRVHSPAYLAFLQSAYEEWYAEVGEAGAQFAMGYTFAMRGLRQGPGKSIHSKLGYFSFDAGAPLVKGSWTAIKASYEVAMTGHKLMTQGGETAVFSLCRPPGHHAMATMAGGYCYINNAAVAAQAFRDSGAKKVAVLDVDYHHGNGTQDIFYDRDDVLFVSLHGHPDQEYPYFAGYADEKGKGAGEGANINYPLPWGTDWSGYGAALKDGIEKIAAFGPDVLVVSLGVDTYKEDPISQFKLDHPDYLRIGEMIAGLKKPTHIIMEGGYAVEEIGINAVNVLEGFLQAAR